MAASAVNYMSACLCVWSRDRRGDGYGGRGMMDDRGPRMQGGLVRHHHVAGTASYDSNQYELL